jgi:hypothetical protein
MYSLNAMTFQGVNHWCPEFERGRTIVKDPPLSVEQHETWIKSTVC